jgi:thiosulfate reductase cytochrome b subunit
MHRIYLHPLPVRIWHWVNAASCVLLLLTGLQIRYVGLINVLPFKTAVTIHNWTGFIVVGDFCLWLAYYVSSARVRSYHADLNPVRYFWGSLRQAIYYSIGIIEGVPNPFHPSIYRKFNPLQAMTYQFIMILLLPLQCITGLLLWNLTGFAGIVTLVGGVRVIDTVHVLIFIIFAFYIPAHVYLAAMGRTPLDHFKAMITGYEEQDVEPAEPAAVPIDSKPAE